MTRIPALLVPLLFALASPAGAFDLVSAGKPAARILLPEKASDEEKAAAGDLVDAVRKMSGAVLPVGDDAPAAEIHVGRTAFVEGQKLDLDALDWDGFVMRTAGADRLILAGRNPHGTRFAVYRFLYKYAGVRWYIPTELGEHIPSRTDFRVGSLDDREEPDYRSRLWSSAARFDGGEWERHNLMRGRYSFHHNLLHVFVPSKLYDAHPDWFPLINGKRAKFADDSHAWQPCLSNEAAQEYAADLIIKHFDANPSATSYSLGINDSNGYCECAGCQALDPPGKPQFRGRPDYSNRVFTFMNGVARRVAAKHPDKLLGCLAYGWCENVPTFPVDPHVIPYLTNDRAQWIDRDFKRQDQELIRRWVKAAPSVGIYDYYYGSGYIIPRLFTRQIKESLKFCKDAGVTAFYAEIYSNWSLDGPKAWVASQLLWDADQDMGALLNDYYTHFFGKAAEPMRRYFELCERQWAGQPGEARWFKYFFRYDQLELFTPEVCRKARALLDEAAARADTDLTRRRVQLTSEGFHYTELYSRVFHEGARLAEATVKDVPSLEKTLAAMADYAAVPAALERHRREVMDANPLHKPVIPMEERAPGSPSVSLFAMLTGVADWARAHGAWDRVRPMLERTAASSSGTDLKWQIGALLYLGDHPDAPELIRNPSAEEAAAGATAPEGPDWSSEGLPPGWSSWMRPNTAGKLTWTNRAARTGKMCLAAVGAEAATFHQVVPGKPGEVFVAAVHARGKVPEKARVELAIQWLDEGGKWFNAPRQAAVLKPGDYADWRPLAVAFKIPEGAGKAWVGAVTYDLGDGNTVYFDDMSVKRAEVAP